MSLTVKKYRYKCTTESKNIHEWRDESEGAPNQCKNDPAHSIDTSSISVIETKEDNVVIIQEEEIKTGGHFQTRQLHMSCAANSWTELDVTWEYPVSILDAEFKSVSNMKEDKLEVVISPDAIVGAITSDVSDMDTVINVDQSVIDNIAIGYKIQLDDLTNKDMIGYITAVDYTNNQIVVTGGASQAFTATPTYVRMSIMMARKFIIGHSGRNTIGGNKIGGSHIPAGTIVRIRYKNKHLTDVKDFFAKLDILY